MAHVPASLVRQMSVEAPRLCETQEGVIVPSLTEAGTQSCKYSCPFLKSTRALCYLVLEHACFSLVCEKTAFNVCAPVSIQLYACSGVLVRC